MNLDFQLYDKQHRYVLSRKRYVGFIGGIGTGKTRALVIKMILKLLDNPGCHCLLTAPTYAMLRDTTKRTFLELVPPDLIAYRNDTYNQIGVYTPDGTISHVYFRSTDNPEHLRGPNLLAAGMDEHSMDTREAFEIVAGRLRMQPEGEQQLFVATTPKGLNHVYELFGPNQTNPLFEAFYASTRENPFLPPSYVHSVYDLYAGAFAAQELEGKFVPYSGLVYGDVFDYNLHIGDYPYNEKWGVDLAWDFGYPAPEAVLAIQQDGAGNVFFFDEGYFIKTLTEDIVADMRARPWWRNVHDCIADEARPDSILRLVNLGVPARPSNKGKILDGIQKVRSLFNVDSTTKKPILHIDRRCTNLIHELSLYRWLESKTDLIRGDTNRETGEEYKNRPIDAYNHLLDAMRYWAVTKWFPTPMVSGREKGKPKKTRRFAYEVW